MPYVNLMNNTEKVYYIHQLCDKNGKILHICVLSDIWRQRKSLRSIFGYCYYYWLVLYHSSSMTEWWRSGWLVIDFLCHLLSAILHKRRSDLRTFHSLIGHSQLVSKNQTKIENFISIFILFATKPFSD